MSVWGKHTARFGATADRPHRLLALDGGGIRGVLTLEILKQIETLLARETGLGDAFRLSQFFDYVAGTSTGAIIAAGIAKGMTVQEMIDFYVNTGPAMFDKQFILRQWDALYKKEPLQRELQSAFGAQTTLHPDDLECMILAVTRNRTTDSPWPISSNPLAKYNDVSLSDCNLNIPLWQIVRASTAAPVFFPPEVIRIDPNDDSKVFVFVDGGVTPYNNPSWLLYRMATTPEYRLNWPVGEDKLMLISLGTGAAPTVETFTGDDNPGLLGNVAGLTGAFMYSMMIDQDTNCRQVGRCVHGAKLDSEIGDMIPRDKAGRPLPLDQDLQRHFLYARYNADISRKGLDKLGLPDIKPEQVQRLDSVEHIGRLQQVGRRVGEEVKIEHFGPFVDSFMAHYNQLQHENGVA